MFYDIAPCTKPRMVKYDKYKKRDCVLRYWAFKEECLLKNVKLFSRMNIVFYMPMPKSWSKKKRLSMEFMPHKSTPDLDNLLKGLLDILDNDSHIYEVTALKVWSTKPRIRIEEIG